MKSSGSIGLSGVDIGTMVQQDGLPLESRPSTMQDWQTTRVSGGVPARAGQVDPGRGSSGVMDNILESLPAPVREFLTEPAPPSTAAMVGVTAVGAVGAHFVPRAVPQASPLVRAALGAAAVVGGHYLAREWWIKSLGYGVLAEGLAEAAYLAMRRRRGEAIPQEASLTNLPAAAQPAALPTPIVQGANLATPREYSEAQFLQGIEDGSIDPDRIVPSGTVIDGSVPPGSVVVLPDGTRLPPSVYVARFPDKVRAARARRLAAGVRQRSSGEPQPEAEYLRWIAEYCILGRGEAEARRLGINPDAVRDSAMRTSRPVRLEDGSLIDVATYNRQYADRVMRAMANCDEMVRRAIAENEAWLRRAQEALDRQGVADGAGAGAGAGGGSNPLRDLARNQGSAPGPIFTLEPAQTLNENAAAMPSLLPSPTLSMQGTATLNPALAGAKGNLFRR